MSFKRSRQGEEEIYTNTGNVVKSPEETVIGITLDSTNLTIDPYDPAASFYKDYRINNTSSDLTIEFRNDIILDWENMQYDIALDSPTSVPIADFNVLASRGNSTFIYTWTGTYAPGRTVLTIPDGYRSISEIQEYIRTEMLALKHVEDDGISPTFALLIPTEYAVDFLNDYSNSILSIETNEFMELELLPAPGGYAQGVLGLFGFVGEQSGGSPTEIPLGFSAAPGATNRYTPLKVANINDQITGYYINCSITKATIDANGDSAAIKQYMVYSEFGSRQDFTQSGPLRWCGVDRFINRISKIRIWVTDNRHRLVDWHGEASTFILLLRLKKLTQ